jgi:hypothetical protein
VVQERSANRDKREHEVKAEKMPLHELPASMGHAGSPDTADIHFCLVSEQVQRYMEIERPREVEKVINNDGEGNNECLASL